MLLFSSFLRAQSNPYIWSGKWSIRLSDLWDMAGLVFSRRATPGIRGEGANPTRRTAMAALGWG